MTNTTLIPPEFATRMVELYGQAGVEWLRDWPSLLTTCEKKWDLKVLAPFAPLSYNYVAPAVCADGKEVVLKVGVPNPELLTEVAALRLYDGRGIVRLLDADAELGIFAARAAKAKALTGLACR